MARREFIIQSREEAREGGLAPLGSRREIEASLASRNTAPESAGGNRLYGPGFEIDLAPDQDPVVQMLLSVSDEDIAWNVILRVGRELQWKIVDPNTGRALSP